MPAWLLKTEPSDFSFDDLVRDRRTRWSGVKNPTAAKHLRAMAVGDVAVIYHTGSERRAVGLARVVTAGDEPELEAGAPLAQSVGLEAIKAAPLFASSPLVTIGRLSVVPLTVAQLRLLQKLGKA